MRISSVKPVQPSAPALRVKAAAPVQPAAQGDTLAVKRPAQKPAEQAETFKLPPTAWLGVGSAGAAVALAAGGLITVAGLPALPVIGAAAALGGVLAIAGLGLTNGWGESATPKPHDPKQADWSLMAVMARATGAIGMAGCMAATGLFTSAFAMSAGAVGVVAWPAAVIATGLVGVLAWGTLKNPNPLGRA